MAVSDTRDGLEKAEYVSRPTLGDMLAKDFFLYAVASGIVVVWVVYLMAVSMVEEDPTAAGGLSNDSLFVIFLLVTLGDVAILGWRIRYYSVFANRGVEAPAKVARVLNLGETTAVEYEYVYEGEQLKGTIGIGGLNPRMKGEGLVGRELFILVNPEKPKKTLVLSKLK